MRRFPVSDHCDGVRFFTPGGMPLPGPRDIWRWWRERKKPRWETHVITPRAAPPARAEDDPHVAATWINHSTFLLQFGGVNVITDPVFCERVGPFGFLGPRRFHAPGLIFETLPCIDAVLLSHDHYDHCDLATLRKLARRDQPRVFAPLGHRDLLKRAGFTDIVEMDWWETQSLAPRAADLAITLTPAQHWTNRLSSARCSRLWGGFFLQTPTRRVYFAGDSGYHAQFFKDIATRCGAPDLALIPIGAYEPRWFMRGQHINPAEAVHIHGEIGARLSIAMHWGAFPLTDEAREAPLEDLRKALAEAGISTDSFIAMEPGESRIV